jgi:hypothetical protein
MLKYNIVLILRLTYLRRIWAPEEKAGLRPFSTIFRASKNPTFLWDMIWLISFCFLITGPLTVCSDYDYNLGTFNTGSFVFCFFAWEAFLRTKFTYVANLPTFVTLSYSCNKSRNFNFHTAKIYMREKFLSSKYQTYNPRLFPRPSFALSFFVRLSDSRLKSDCVNDLETYVMSFYDYPS